MNKYEVFYTYCIDASTTIECDTPEEAEALVEAAWRKGDATKEKLQDFSDFEVLNCKKLNPPKTFK